MWKLMVAGVVVAVVLLAWAAWCWDKSHDYQVDHDQYSALLDGMVFDGYEPERGLFVGASSRDVYEATTKAENRASTYRSWAVLLAVPGVASGVGGVLLGRRGRQSPDAGARRLISIRPHGQDRTTRSSATSNVNRGTCGTTAPSRLHNAPLLGRAGAVLIVLGLILPCETCSNGSSASRSCGRFSRIGLATAFFRWSLGRWPPSPVLAQRSWLDGGAGRGGWRLWLALARRSCPLRDFAQAVDGRIHVR